MVGMFINTLPVRVTPRPAETLGPAADPHPGRSRRRLIEHQHLGLHHTQRLTGVGELFDTLTVVENYPLDPDMLDSAGSGLRVTEAGAEDATHYPRLVAVPGPRLSLRLGYRPELFAADGVRAIGTRLNRLLEAIATGPAHIFQPLGMTHATFRQPLPAALAPDMSAGYAQASQPAKPFEIVVAAPAGSLSASGADMARFMIAHLQDGEYHGARILSAETARRMHDTPLTMIPPLNRMELGFYEQNYNGHRVISHGGDTEYFHSYLHLFLDDHVGLFVSVNSAGREGAAHAIREALFEEFARRYFPAAAPAPATLDAATATAHARLIAGYYDDSRRPDRSFFSVLALMGPVHVIADKDGRVSVTLLKGLNEAPRWYREVAPFVWLDDATGWRLAAKVVDGKVVRFSADELSPFMVFAKAMLRFWGGKVSARMDCSLGCRPPPAAPCRTRKKTSMPSVGARPQSSDAVVNRKTQLM